MASTSEKAILYSGWISSCAWRVRLALNLKKIPFEIRPVDVRTNYHATIEELKKINPIAQIPILQIDGQTLIESLNIFAYLEETRPEHPLLPSDRTRRCRVREICEVIVSGIQPFQNVNKVIVGFIGEERGDEWGRFWINRGFEAVETLLRASSGRFCVGDEITWADCCLVPQYYNALLRFKMDLSLYPIICRVCEELEKHPDFVKSHAFNQPDSPSDAESTF